MKQFSYCLNPEHDNFEPVFVMSALLDLRNAPLLEPHQNTWAAKKELFKHLVSSTSQEEGSNSSTAESVSNHNADDASDEPPPKEIVLGYGANRAMM